jgi:N,N-dimethylformamidase beta subunit-like, C-terminal
MRRRLLLAPLVPAGVLALLCCSPALGAANANAYRAAHAAIQAENQRPGTRSWVVTHPDLTKIAGYTDRMSFAPGDQVPLYVDSHGDPWTYRVYRLGYYHGRGGRLVVDTTGPIAGVAQPAFTLVNPGHLSIPKTPWTSTAAVQTAGDWVSGVYLVQLTDTANGAQSYVSFTLTAKNPAPAVVVLPTNTYTAYNRWLGWCTYYNSQIESMNRPYFDGDGAAGRFFTLDYPLIYWLEKHSFPVSYATDDDDTAGTTAGPATKLVIESGHAEYQTWRARTYLEKLLAHGVSLALFGGNSWTAQARVDLKNRIYTFWRAPGTDPIKPPHATVLWMRDGWYQNALTGVVQAWGKPIGRARVQNQSSWAWQGAGVSDNMDVTPMLGLEHDGISTHGASSPRGLQILTRIPLQYWGKGKVAPSSEMVLTNRPAGSFVFAAGMLGFNWSLSYPNRSGWPESLVQKTYPSNARYVNVHLQRMAANLIQRATGYPNPIAARANPYRRQRVEIQDPVRLEPATRTTIVNWTGTPRGARYTRIAIGHRHVATVPAGHETWTGHGQPLGKHTVELTFVDRSGRRIATAEKTYTVAPANSSVFRYAFSLYIDYGDDAGPALQPPPYPVWEYYDLHQRSDGWLARFGGRTTGATALSNRIVESPAALAAGTDES